MEVRLITYNAFIVGADDKTTLAATCISMFSWDYQWCLKCLSLNQRLCVYTRLKRLVEMFRQGSCIYVAILWIYISSSSAYESAWWLVLTVVRCV